MLPIKKNNLQPSLVGGFNPFEKYEWVTVGMMTFPIYGYGSIAINTIFRGMNIHKSQLFWGSPGVPGFWHTAIWKNRSHVPNHQPDLLFQTQRHHPAPPLGPCAPTALPGVGKFLGVQAEMFQRWRSKNLRSPQNGRTVVTSVTLPYTFQC